jgi:His Kinase A (phospho-acceptor) domain
VNSISRRLTLQIALLTMVVLGAVFAGSWWSVSMLMKERSRDELDFRTQILVQSIAGAAKSGDGETAILRKMEQVASMRPGTLLEVYRSDGTLLYADAKVPEHSLSAHVLEQRFRVDAPGVPGGAVNARLVVDFEDNARMGQRWAWILFVATIVGGTIVAAGAWWRVRRELLPLKQLAGQTQRISADRLDQRLALPVVADELQPWIAQFNALMERLQAAMQQLDAFNADVAHEMRTPIAALMGHIEVSLSRERPAGELRETMALSLEELQKLSSLIDDMLFLSFDSARLGRAGARVPRVHVRGRRRQRPRQRRRAGRGGRRADPARTVEPGCQRGALRRQGVDGAGMHRAASRQRQRSHRRREPRRADRAATAAAPVRPLLPCRPRAQRLRTAPWARPGHRRRRGAHARRTHAGRIERGGHAHRLRAVLRLRRRCDADRGGRGVGQRRTPARHGVTAASGPGALTLPGYQAKAATNARLIHAPGAAAGAIIPPCRI